MEENTKRDICFEIELIISKGSFREEYLCLLHDLKRVLGGYLNDYEERLTKEEDKIFAECCSDFLNKIYHYSQSKSKRSGGNKQQQP